MSPARPIVSTPLDALRVVAERWDCSPRRDPAIVRRVGPHIGCSVLKLQKSAWTNDSLADMSNQTGIFFSIWTSDKGLHRDVAQYNIHAMSLRLLRGHRIKGTEFAARFREAFAAQRSLWPNVRTDFGPATLMEGHFPFRMERFVRDAEMLLKQFDALVPLIDRLLLERSSTGPVRAEIASAPR